ncbi:fungal-specific transcription factor domain-containing protein [Ilyonectria sp. MPI-CAGE-AT-0026]|nr:fungal-specific transcription factor domain-containing protein [Ilyonectria sp. MPI-CAGE-AT-0026]
MLLYAKRAQPKPPNTRSRAGCTSCKNKKRKCDETRPQCGRCQSHNVDCIYGPIKPRKRHVFKSTLSSNNRLARSLLSAATLVNSISLSSRPTTCSQDHHDQDAAVVYRSDDFNSPRLEDEIAKDSETSAHSPSLSQVIDAHRGSSPSSTVAASNPTDFPLGPSISSSSFADFSTRRNRQELLAHFCTVLSRLMVLEDRCENPFNRIILPLCQYSQLVRNAVYTLASAHLEFHGVANDEKAAFFYSRSTRNLEYEIGLKDDVKRNELLAASIIFIYYEALFQNARSTLIKKYLNGVLTTLGDVATDANTAFLEDAFRYYDVISGLSLGTAPLSSAPRLKPRSRTPVSNRRDSASADHHFDTLLGMSNSLWPIMHRLSSLVSLRDQLDQTDPREVLKVAVLRAELDFSASAIEAALSSWQPDMYTGDSHGENFGHDSKETTETQARMQSLLSNSLAYRHSALIYLYRRIRCLPHNHKLVSPQAHLSLKHCVKVAKSAGPMGALLWPLFIAACEATNLKDREMATISFSLARKRQGMMNIDRAWILVQEIWVRQDEEDLLDLEETGASVGLGFREEIWRTVGNDMGIGVILG